MAIGSGTAGFAQGLASGFQTGARYGIEAEDMRARRDMEGRRLKMAEDTAEINKRTGQLQNEALERSAAKQKAQDEAWTMALNELAGGQPIEGDEHLRRRRAADRRATAGCDDAAADRFLRQFDKRDFGERGR